MQRSAALTVVRATTRLRVLARQSREAAAAAAAEAEAAENGGEHPAAPNGLGIPFLHVGGDGEPAGLSTRDGHAPNSPAHSTMGRLACPPDSPAPVLCVP